jgi:hypothetical protein
MVNLLVVTSPRHDAMYGELEAVGCGSRNRVADGSQVWIYQVEGEAQFPDPPRLR